MAQVSSKVTFKCGLRGFHVYGTFWFPIQDEPISFKREFSNQHDRFAVAGQNKTSIQWTPGSQIDRSNQKVIFSKK